MFSQRTLISAIATLVLMGLDPSQAAYLRVDDSAPGTFTVEAGGFVGLNMHDAGGDTWLISDIGQHISITLPDSAVVSFDGWWPDDWVGEESGPFALFSPNVALTDVFASGFYTRKVRGERGEHGEVLPVNFEDMALFGYTGTDWWYRPGGAGAWPQDGRTVTFTLHGLEVSFRSEIDEPATLGLATLAALALVGSRLCRRRQAAA